MSTYLGSERGALLLGKVASVGAKVSTLLEEQKDGRLRGKVLT